MNIPNTITTIRIILALITYALIQQHMHLWWAFVLSLIVIFGDFLDGYFARRLNQSTKFGAWLDIAGDRFVEIGFWIVFAMTGIISMWIAMIFLLRGILVDGIRAFASEDGHTAFGTSTMMQSWWGVALVSSRFSRFTYAAAKMLCFCVLILAMIYPCILSFGQGLAIFCTIFCLIRGFPVLMEGAHYLRK